MNEISIDNAKPGMIITKSITNDNGEKLVKAGSQLDENLLHTLKNRGIETLHIEASDDALSDEETEEIQQLDQNFEEMIENFGKEKELLEKIKTKVIDHLSNNE